MAKWYEVANEASFKPASNGFVFRTPNPWLFAPSRYFLVNDAQKAAIMPALGRWRILFLAMTCLALPLMVGAIFFLRLKLHYSDVITLALAIVPGLFLMLVVPHLYLQHTLQPLLAGLQRSDQRFTWRDQRERTARAMSRKMLFIGVSGGVLMTIGGLMSLIDSIFDGRAGIQLFSPLLTLGMGALAATYFFALVRLKSKLAQVGP